MQQNYVAPEIKIVKTKAADVITTSGGEDFNMLGDKANSVFFKNSNWTIEL